jgi:hypothetical protein
MGIRQTLEPDGYEKLALGAISFLLSIFSLALFVFIFLSLRDLLNRWFKFRAVDQFIKVLVWASAGITLIEAVPLISPELEKPTAILMVILVIPLGIVTIVFAIKLLKLSEDLFGMLKPFAYTTMATGFLSGTIILIPLAILVGGAADVILGIIFFRAAEAVARGE